MWLHLGIEPMNRTHRDILWKLLKVIRHKIHPLVTELQNPLHCMYLRLGNRFEPTLEQLFRTNLDANENLLGQITRDHPSYYHKHFLVSK